MPNVQDVDEIDGDDDGTPEVQVVIEAEETFEDIYEHRRDAKDRSASYFGAAIFDTCGPLNASSFGDLDKDSSPPLDLLFSRSHARDRKNLEKLQVLSVVGRGTFGKIFLVYLKAREEFYALKSMRKDVM